MVVRVVQAQPALQPEIIHDAGWWCDCTASSHFGEALTSVGPLNKIRQAGHGTGSNAVQHYITAMQRVVLFCLHSPE